MGLEARALIQDALCAPDNSDEPQTAVAPTLKDNFFAYDDMWVGREALTETLLAKLKGACRLLLLVGISGVGKTALGERLALSLSAERRLIRENFDNQDQSTDFGSFAARLLGKCGQDVTAEERQDPQQLGRRLAEHIKRTPYLLVIDAWEKILSGDEMGQSTFQDEGYLLWLQQIISAEACESRLIVTSQALSASLSEAASRYPNFWHVEPLMGLSETEQIELFDKTGLDVQPSSSTRPYLERIGQAYGGHPLALRVITGEIGSRPFFGNVVAYWKKYGGEIEAVEQAIAQAAEGKTTGVDDNWKLDRLTQAVRRNVRKRLEQTFTRLNQEARQAYLLLCEASVYRCAVPEDWWLSHLEFWDCDEAAQQAAIEALRDRCLIEESIEDDECLVKQHNLIRSVSLDHLKKLEQ